MSETPQPSSPITETPSRASPTPVEPSSRTAASTPSTAKGKKPHPQAGVKVSAEVLERRRLGRIKAAETMALKIKKSGIERRENPVRYSVFDNVNLINQKNYFTDYLKRDDQTYILRERKILRWGKTAGSKSGSHMPGGTPSVGATNGASDDIMDDDDDEDDDGSGDEGETDEDRTGRKIIVIHPGSKYIRIGLSTDIYPTTIPFVVAIPGKNTSEPPHQPEGEVYESYKKLLVRDFKERMKYYKRRIIPNSGEIAANFNKKVQAEEIPEHNDVHRMEFVKPPSPAPPKSIYFGNDAMRLDSDDYTLRYPLITHGKFNESAYSSVQENLGEIQLFLIDVIKRDLEITDFKNYKVVLVVPDLYDKIYIERFMDLLLQMQFQAVALIQESLAATYGAGVSSACVVDIGAKTTKVACVDDGLILPNSRGIAHFGGDDITRYFYRLLRESSFPIDLDEKVPHEWVMMEQLKEKFITFQDANITVQLYSFIKRYRNKLSEKYEFKVFDEVILAPMALFFPQVFAKDEYVAESKPFTSTVSLDIFTNLPDNPTSTTQRNIKEGLYADMQDFDILKDLLNADSQESGDTCDTPAIAPLEKLIIQSIANASRYDFATAKQFYSNILIVGGSSKIESLDFILTDRINIWRPKILALAAFPDFIKQVESIISKFEKEKEMSKLQTEEELQPLQEELYGIIEKELETFLDTASTGVLSVEVLPSPKDIDPSIMVWKGGSVFARIKLCKECFVSPKDWDMLGPRAFQYKTLWNY